jgi:predicted small secreted protein
MKRSLLIATALLLCTGCSATWKGMKEDTSSAATWTKGEVNQGATSVKEKTEK